MLLACVTNTKHKSPKLLKYHVACCPTSLVFYICIMEGEDWLMVMEDESDFLLSLFSFKVDPLFLWIGFLLL